MWGQEASESGSIVTPGNVQESMACRNASIAALRGKLLRQTNATCRMGDGSLKGRWHNMPSALTALGADALGKTVMPMPEATMWRMVSSDDPSKVRAIPSLLVA